MLEFQIGDKRIAVCVSGVSEDNLEPGRAYPVIYMHSFEAGQAERIAKLCKQECILVNLPWVPELTPWPAKRAFPKGDDFTGGADGYIAELVDIIIPTAENKIAEHYKISIDESRRGLTGYSLAGLFALYTAYQTAAFPLTGSMSGSLWYNHFAEYVTEHEVRQVSGRRFYFSLGDREERVREERMRNVAKCTKQIVEHLKEKYDVTFVWNSGGHFTEPEKRMAAGIDMLLDRPV